MTALPTFLAHAGPGATWQALLTTVAIGLGIVLVLVVVGTITLREPGDLILPLAAVAILSSFAPLLSATLSDWVGWAVPPAVLVLVLLVVAASTSVDLHRSAANAPAILLAVVVLGALASWAVGDDLNRAWHPTEGTLPLADDGTVTIQAPVDGAEVPAGPVTVEVTLTGATVGPDDLAPDDVPDDPEELGRLRLFVDGVEVDTPIGESCTVEAPCTEVSWDLDLAPGAHTLIVEFVRHDGVPLAPAIFDRRSLTATG